MRRKDSKQTLVELTREFIELLRSSKGADIDLTKAEKTLGASKRRLYDVSNVLSGVGLIERCGKARVKWIGRASGGGDADVHQALIDREKELDAMIGIADNCLNELAKSQAFQMNAWITEDDVATLNPEGNVNLFALRGPPSMTIQIFNQEDGEHHMVCRTDEGKIEMVQIDTSNRH